MIKQSTLVENDFYYQLGRIVRLLRTRERLTQQELSDRLKLSRSSVANIESGRQKILLHQLFELASALNAQPSDLLPQSNEQDLVTQLRAGHHSAGIIAWANRILNSTEKLHEQTAG